MARATDPVAARAAATQIVATLRNAGHLSLFAGGCVRDELLGLRPTDYDIATAARPPQVRGLFRSVHEVGEAFGVMLVTVGGVTVEVATFRTDGAYTDARRPDSVSFADDKADALRRDFTVNALFLDPHASGHGQHSPMGGLVIDYVGGLADLNARLIRAVGNPDARLNEDHLRALRAVRFASRLGFAIHPDTAAAITAHAAQLKGVSRERIGEEVRRMLSHSSPAARANAIQTLQHLTLDAPALNEPTQEVSLNTVHSLSSKTPYSTVLAAWLIDRHALHSPDQAGNLPEPTPHIGRIRSALCLTNLERDELTDLFECLHSILGGWLEKRVATQKRWAARSGFTGAVALIRPHVAGLAERVMGRMEVLRRDGVGIKPYPHIDGRDLIELGFRPGPVFKSLLERLYDEQLEGRLDSKSEGLELARVWGV